ncbi:hypothetical protein COCCADRAFT_110278 [Bipolaris zeicola 26-R-13]|uniref:Zn(2)-C6 fungal-type domain-containing protein n=1 Tax=Cochliobolus carbonum (strain 26-R-13) TaxID=930089 RepID=W6YA06_COCC2|nr:uncharacterized protein COCCADRAFT_110278 [Bipolaris zeicola 26-R-13]EUC27996.1 hypothetical protein COCCADRAFT_110278 [Bipolaris zeicola 26-R-13]
MPPDGNVKKERGCFQCSCRRIVCDKTEPSCRKCAKKGIECSGMGRIRFAEGVARRGRLKDCKIPKTGGDDSCKELPNTIEFQLLRWPGEERARKKRKSDLNETAQGPPTPHTINSTGMHDGREAFLLSAPINTNADSEADMEDIGRGYNSIVVRYSESYEIVPWVAPIDPKLRMLFSYFSHVVAPAMVVFDDNKNGYRSLVLPMALEDDLLRQAVGVVAAQHLSHQRPELQGAAEAGRAAVISRLRNDSLQQSADKVFNKFTWATLVVLLVGETVTGSADYRFFVQMLLSLSMSNPGRDADPIISNFLQAQTNMFELLGVPLLGEEVGVLTMMKASESLMSFLSFSHLPEDSEDRRIADLILQCFVSACNIYTRCAVDAHAVSRFHDTIQEESIHQLIGLISQVSPNDRGAHALVWVCFVAGAASTDQSQRDFFVHRMEQVYARTRFRNIPTAIQSLKNIWARRPGERWTVCLPQLSNVLVM